jgi:hypothetical protein
MLPFRANGIFRKNLPETLGLTEGAKPHRALPSPDRKMTEFART